MFSRNIGFGFPKTMSRLRHLEKNEERHRTQISRHNKDFGM